MTDSLVHALIWFRTDLRIADNHALTQAIEYAKQQQSKVKAVYIATPEQWQMHQVAPIQLDFIERQLNELAHSLIQIDIEFELLTCQNFNQIPALLAEYCQQQQISAIFVHKEPEINEIRRDQFVTQRLSRIGVSFFAYDGHALLPPGQVINQAGQMFRVFTPFARRWRQILQQNNNELLIAPTPSNIIKISNVEISFDCDKADSCFWPVGEDKAHERLDYFLQTHLLDYQTKRDFPALSATSSLSPYLALGIISPRQCLDKLLTYVPDALDNPNSLGFSWLNELCWRDFYRHLLVAFPKLCMGKNYNANANKIQWRNDETDFQRWCEGKTGFPLIDAAMLQLKQMGWMHNRLRMLVASFLTKHLLIDWRWGEAFFRRHLIDGDLAANNGGWQWAAGTGCDAQPYFRIFNPMFQCEKFDPQAEFIYQYLPELKKFSPKALHQVGVTEQYLPESYYPRPIVQHKAARERALMALSVMKSVSKSNNNRKS